MGGCACACAHACVGGCVISVFTFMPFSGASQFQTRPPALLFVLNVCVCVCVLI